MTSIASFLDTSKVESLGQFVTKRCASPFVDIFRPVLDLQFEASEQTHPF